MQRFCISAGLNFRVREVRSYSELHSDRLLDEARFEVFYTDWRLMGQQMNPMQPNVKYSYYEIEDMKLRAEVAHDLSQ